MAPVSKSKKRPVVTLKQGEEEKKATAQRKKKENATSEKRKEKENATTLSEKEKQKETTEEEKENETTEKRRGKANETTEKRKGKANGTTEKRKGKANETTEKRKGKAKETTTRRAKDKENEESHEVTLTLNEPARKRQRQEPLNPRKAKPKDVERKTRAFQILKHEVLAPYFAELFLKRHFQNLLDDLVDEATLAETPPRANSQGVEFDANNTSYQDDWRSDGE